MHPDEPQIAQPKAIRVLLTQAPAAPRVRASHQPRGERDELISFFTERINRARAGTRFKPLAPRAIAVKLSKLSLQALYALKSGCTDAERRGVPFSAAFWSELKRDLNLPLKNLSI